VASKCKVLLLGPPLVRCGGGDWYPPTQRAMALLAYLANRGRGERRERLMSLLWDAPEQTARHRLRQELYRLHGGPLGEYLQSDRENIWLQGLESDAGEFLGHLEAGAWSEALALWRGEFMEGFSLPRAEAFADWLLLERENWCNRYIFASSQRAQAREAAGDLSGAVADWQGVLNCDPLNEEAIKHLIRLLASLGRWPEVDDVVNSYRARVVSEMGLEPDTEVIRLYGQLKQRQEPPRLGRAPLPDASFSNCRRMDEHVFFFVFSFNETISFSAIEPLYFTF
jgi:DNA-binding SARP family transcriptional activator